MKTGEISSKFFKENRARLYTNLKPNGIVILTSNDVLPTNADGHMGFRQNSDFFYFSGIDQEDSFLILFPDAKEHKHSEILFVKETSEHIRKWDGPMLTKEEAKQQSGIETVMHSHQFWDMLPKLVYYADAIYLNQNETGHVTCFKTKERRLIDQLRKQFPLHKFERLAPLVYPMRMIKSKIEIDMLERAIQISKLMFERAAKALKPDMYEFEIEAELTYELLKSGSRHHAFMPIVASGANACVLHYIKNNQKCMAGDLLLMDFGAECFNYNADISRTIPVAGVYSERQKEVYNATLYILKKAKEKMVVGQNFKSLNLFVGQLLDEVLVQLGLLTKEEVKKYPFEHPNPAFRKYMPHSISHFLGLDVHDVGSKFETFQAGMVITNEPGIYIDDENLGIRIENDILITQSGNRDLMEGVAIEISEIETLMQN